VQARITDNAQGEKPLTPAVLRDYVGTLNRCSTTPGSIPTPPRDRRVRFPTAERVIPIPPTNRQVLALLEHIPHERRLFFAFLEQNGGRLGEHIAFTWGDVDVGASRILARPEVVKGRRGRQSRAWSRCPSG
jgi:integrase